MSFHFRSAILLTCLALTACDPAPDDEAKISEAEKQIRQEATGKPQGVIPALKNILEASGLGVKDERSEIILLLNDARVAMQEFQRNGLAMLVGRQAGLKLTTQDAAGSAKQQADQFRQAIAAKPAAIFINPIDPATLAALIVEASTAGITVIGLDKRMLNEGCASIVYCDQRKAGRMAADIVIEALKRKADEEGRADITGRVVELRGVEDSFPTNELAEGFNEGLRTQPGVILIHDAPTDWKPEEATARTAEAIRLQKQFDVIFGHNDAIALGGAKAVESAGQRETTLIIGTDGITGAKKGMELVRQGDLDATIVQPALIDLALQILLKMREDKTFKPEPAYEVEPFAVVPKNVEQALRVGTYKLPKL